MEFIEPTPEQLQTFATMPIEGPIVMLNLLSFKPDGGEESYAKYGAHTLPLVEVHGGRILYQGSAAATIIGDEKWDLMILVEYPSRQAFFDMVTSPEYQEHAHLRTLALNDSRLVCTQPMGDT